MMATRANDVVPLDGLLAILPTLPRPLVSRLTARMIERLDEIDGDPEAEDDDSDRCPAGDDGTAPFWFMGNLYWGASED